MDKIEVMSTEDESGVFSQAPERVTAQSDHWSFSLFYSEKGCFRDFMHWEGSKRALGSVLKEISRVTSGHSDQLIANMLKYMALWAKEVRGTFLKVSEQGNAGSDLWSLWALESEKNRN